MYMELLDSSKEKAALSFNKEARNIEFNQLIGKMDANCRANSKLRDEILVNLGKRLFKKHPPLKPKNRLFSVRIIKWTRLLSQKEIESLLLPAKASIFRVFISRLQYRTIWKIKDILWWEISIWFKNKSYVISLRKKRKTKPYLTDSFERPKITEVLTQDEINMLLKPLDE